MGKKATKAWKKSTAQQPNWGVWIWIKWKPGTPSDAWRQWHALKEVKEAWSTSGDWDCSLWADIDSPEAVEKFVWNKIRSNQWVDKTETHWSKKCW
jgi:DNA-binding Lrp family transcriptional regulator